MSILKLSLYLEREREIGMFIYAFIYAHIPRFRFRIFFKFFVMKCLRSKKRKNSSVSTTHIPTFIHIFL